MNKNCLNKYILFIFISFLSFTGVTFAANSIGPGETRSVTGSNCRIVEGPLSKVSEVPSKGITVIYDQGDEAGRTARIECDGGKNYDFVTTKAQNSNVNLGLSDEANLINIVGASKVTNVKVVGGGEYVELLYDNCPDNQYCNLRVKPTADSAGVNVSPQVEITYINGSGQEVTTKITLNLGSGFNGARAYFGGASCGFDSNWTKRSTDGYNFYQGNGSAVLPSCTISSSYSEMQFKGWQPGDNKTIVNAIGECSNAVSAGTTVSSGNYSACFEGKKTVQISVNEGSITNPQDWRNTNGSGFIYIGSGDKATLPDLVFEGFDKGKSLKEWTNGSEVKQPGDEVELNGDIWKAVIEHTTVIRDYYKRIYIGKTETLNVSGITGCSATGSELTANWDAGEGKCSITGNSATADGSYVDVNVTTDSETITFKFSVLTMTGLSQNGDEDFVIDTSANVSYDTGVTVNEEGGIISEVPKNFYVQYSHQSYNFPSDVSKAIGNSLMYDAYWPENGVDKAHVTFCIDPGLWGPGSKYAPATVYYEIQENIETMPEDLAKIVSYIVENYVYGNEDSFHTGASAARAAANIAIRIVAINNDVDSGTASSGLNTHYNNYVSLAASIKALSDTDYNETKIKEIFSNKVGLSGEVLDLTASMLANYRTQPKPEGLGNDVSRTIDVREAAGSTGNNYTVHYTGTVVLPSGATGTPSLGLENCNANTASTGVECTGGITGRNDTESVAQGKEVWNYDITLNVDGSKIVPPKNDEDKKKMAYTLEFTGGTNVHDVYIAKPINGGRYQRMIVFDMKNDAGKIYLYFSPIPNVCLDIPSLDPNTCNSDTDCPPPFNKELFKISGCCADILDETSYVAQSVCLGKCTTSTFASVCKYPGSDDEAKAGELYQIKEGSTYSAGTYTNKIGECIANVSDEFKTTARDSFARKDDLGNSINVDSYSDNRYCAVTCKEDWILSMDTFGNYVGERAVAAGTWFQILNDIYIGGSRSCYTSYIDYDKYMNELANESNEIVKNYNNYNIYSRQYTDIDNQVNGQDKKIKEENLNASCILYHNCDDVGVRPSNLDSSVDPNYNDTKGKCFADKTPTCPTGYSYDSTNNNCKKPKTCPAGTAPGTSCYDTASVNPVSGMTLNGSTDMMEVEYELPCKTKGQTLDYALPTNNKVTDENEKFRVDNQTNEVTTVFGSTIKTQNPLNVDNKINYTRTDKIQCKITIEKGDDAEATLECKYIDPIHSYSKPVDVNEAISTLQGNLSDMSLFCKDTVTVNSFNFCKCGNAAEQPESYACEYTSDMLQKRDEVLENVMGPDVKNSTEKIALDFKTKVSSSYQKIYEYSGYMYDCQHFELYNTSDDTKTYEYYDTNGTPQTLSYANNTPRTGVILGENRKYVQINTAYNPVGSYTYDEKSFMTILGKDNVLVPDMKKNDEVMGSSYVGITDDEKPADVIAYDKHGNKYGQSIGGEDVFLSRNKIETSYYSHDNTAANRWTKDSTPDKWRNYDDNTDPSDPNETTKVITLCTIGEHSGLEYNAYSGADLTNSGSHGYENTSVYEPFTNGENDVKWTAGTCYQVNVKYYKTHYITSKISNSSFYKNKGNWYQRGNDIKEHGDTWKLALDNANSRPGSATNYNENSEKGHWSVMGTKNVFPISLTTPRNLYQYTYTFADIGSYSDGKLGRVMGDEDSIIKLNTRACFYEVYEEMCLCCGSEIVSYVEGSTGVTQQFIDDNSFDYKLIQETSPDYNKLTENKDGILNIASSSVSLNDLSSNYGTGRTTPVNWSDNSPFFYNGTTYFTDKGDVAIKEIEVKGENIYADTPEYSYLLTPSTLSAIRDYNASNGYEVNFNNLKVYGRYTIEPVSSCSGSSCDWGDTLTDFQMDNDYITFRHYGSKFLEEEMEDLGAVYDGTISKYTGDDNVCYVVQGDIDTSNDENDLVNKVKNEKCRWVDYVSTNGGTFRLAFK